MLQEPQSRRLPCLPLISELWLQVMKDRQTAEPLHNDGCVCPDRMTRINPGEACASVPPIALADPK